MNTRLKELRKKEDLSQKEFGDKIFLSQYQISLLESGKRNITDRVIDTICKEFKVNREWFKYGKGEMYLDCLKDMDVDDEVKELTNKIFELDQEDRKAILSMINLLEKKNK